jgi:hypothetical protein
MAAQGSISGHYDSDKGIFVPDDPTYTVGSFVDGSAIVQHQGKFGILDSQGKLVRPIDQAVQTLPYPMMVDGKPFSTQGPPPTPFGVVLIDESGLQLKPNSICGIGNGGIYFLADLKGRLLLPYRLVWRDLLGRYLMYRPNHLIYFTIFDDSDKENDIQCARCGHCYGYTGILNRKGELIVTPDRYKDIQDFKEGRAQVRNAQGKIGFIDEAGCEIIPCSFDEATDFQNGYATVRRDKDRHRIDPLGKRVGK